MDRAASAPDSVWDMNGMVTANNINALLAAATGPMDTSGTMHSPHTSGPTPSLTSRFADLFLDLDRIERAAPHVRSPQPLNQGREQTHYHNPNHRQNVTSAVLMPEYDRPNTIQLSRQEFDRVKMTVKVLSDQLTEIHDVLRKLVPFLHQVLLVQKSSEQQGMETIMDKVHPFVEQRLTNHLHSIQNILFSNIQTAVDAQEAKFAEMNKQILMLTAAMNNRDQKVTPILE